MTASANFQVDPRLATLLGESYRSSEKALKELVDNAWDANAENVWIALPDLWGEEPIVIRDDGDGMSEREVRDEYLAIANPRSSRKGKITPVKKRRVKGHKGIGKFAGLVAAGKMTIESRRGGVQTTLTIVKNDILKAKRDLEKINLPIEIAPCDKSDHGVTVTLSDLSSRYNPPSVEKMRDALALEYGREPDFTIFLNDEELVSHAVKGRKYSRKARLPQAGAVRLRFTIMDDAKGARNCGVVTRVAGKVVGAPGFFGLEERDDIPRRMRNRIVGEIEADGLEEDLNADWEFLREDGKAYRQTQKWAREQLEKALEAVLVEETRLAKARLPQVVKKRLGSLPEYRRRLAGIAVDDLIRRFAGEAPARLSAFVGTLLDAFERDEYAMVCDRMNESSDRKPAPFAAALADFGNLERALLAAECQARLHFLDHLARLAAKTDTLGKEMLKALENNLWVFGPEYSLMTSDKDTAVVVAKYGSKRFAKTRTGHTPDLLLTKDVEGYYLLVEFRHPSATAARDAEAQATHYRQDLEEQLGGNLEIIVVAGDVDEEMAAEYEDSDTSFVTYESLVLRAKNQYAWVMKENASATGPADENGADES